MLHDVTLRGMVGEVVLLMVGSFPLAGGVEGHLQGRRSACLALLEGFKKGVLRDKLLFGEWVCRCWEVSLLEPDDFLLESDDFALKGGCFTRFTPVPGSGILLWDRISVGSWVFISRFGISISSSLGSVVLEGWVEVVTASKGTSCSLFAWDFTFNLLEVFHSMSVSMSEQASIRMAFWEVSIPTSHVEPAESSYFICLLGDIKNRSLGLDGIS